MMRTRTALAAVAASLASSVALPAHAANDADLTAIRQEMNSLKTEYEKKIADLERKLKRAEERSYKGSKTPKAGVNGPESVSEQVAASP